MLQAGVKKRSNSRRSPKFEQPFVKNLHCFRLSSMDAVDEIFATAEITATITKSLQRIMTQRLPLVTSRARRGGTWNM